MNLAKFFTQAHIATALTVIAFVLVFVVFGRLPQKRTRKK